MGVLTAVLNAGLQGAAGTDGVGAKAVLGDASSSCGLRVGDALPKRRVALSRLSDDDPVNKDEGRAAGRPGRGAIAEAPCSHRLVRQR